MKKNNKSEYYTGGETKMISESYIKDLLLSMGYIKKNHIYEKFFPSVDCYIKVDLKNRSFIDKNEKLPRGNCLYNLSYNLYYVK